MHVHQSIGECGLFHNSNINLSNNSQCRYFINAGDFLMPGQVIVTLSPGNMGAVCHPIQSFDDQIHENQEMLTFALFSDDPAVTQINPSGGQIIVFDNDGKIIICYSWEETDHKIV